MQMRRFSVAGLAALLIASAARAAAAELYLDPIDVRVPDAATDPAVRRDYDIVYVRVPRAGGTKHPTFAEVFHPAFMDSGGDLMLLHPDGTEEVLVEGGPGSVLDPYVSFDGEWVYYARLEDLTEPQGGRRHGRSADIFKIHVASRKIVRLTEQQFTSNTGMTNWPKGDPGYGVFNLGPCPLPGGRVMFVSNRNAFRPNKGYTWPCLQLFTMDDDGRNVEMIGYINLGSALHPTILRDGRVLFSSYEAQGLRDQRIWGLWSIHPDGTNWEPVVSALFRRPNAIHFQTQLTDGSLIVEDYYNLNNNGFGPLYKLPERPPTGDPGFGPAYTDDERNAFIRMGRFSNGKPAGVRSAFTPVGMQAFPPFVNSDDNPADLSVIGDKASPRVGKFTHPSGAPDNHLLVCYSPGPANHHYGMRPESHPVVDSGLYLVKDGRPIEGPAEMRLIKNDPKYNEQWPRALVSYKRTYGVDEPKSLAGLHKNDGAKSKQLPVGTPFGLVGTSSLYKRESFPGGAVAKGSVTATWGGSAGGHDPYQGWDPFNDDNPRRSWTHQGAEAGRYENADIHAVRIVAMEGTTDDGGGPNRRFYNHANERMRILGEIPVRKFRASRERERPEEPLDPDGNPDTSFLAKIPADVAFTFQTLDRRGMLLNMAQTWHQVRPGEIRNNCGGCHAHSQQPTEFLSTAAARDDYQVFDLTARTPLLTTKADDESKTRWDADDATGLRYTGGVKNVEYHRDVVPILRRSCTACHTERDGNKPAGNLVLDDDSTISIPNGPSAPGTYYRLAADDRALFGHKPVLGRWSTTNASRYVRKFQSRRSLLIWKVYGERLDGFTNDEFPTDTTPGDAATLAHHGKPLEPTLLNKRLADLDFTGSAMPPPAAVKSGKVRPLSDEDRLTLVRWIDLGCPLDLTYRPEEPKERGYGWMGDDQRPTLTLTYPQPGRNEALPRIVVGMHDYYTGLDPASFTVTADFAVNGVAAGKNLADLFREASPGVRVLDLERPAITLPAAKLTVSIKDRQGNVTQIERTFSVERKGD